jgi:hypothetical protein
VVKANVAKARSTLKVSVVKANAAKAKSTLKVSVVKANVAKAKRKKVSVAKVNVVSNHQLS